MSPAPSDGTARAVLHDRYGGPEVLVVTDVPQVHPGPGEVRVRVRAAGINPFDSKVRSGRPPYTSDDPFPRGVGQDFAGVADEVSRGARYPDGSSVAVGDEVIGFADRCCVREQLVVPDTQVVRKPPGLSWAVAGALPTPGRTALTCLDLLKIGPEDTLLVGAAAGGVGVLLGQLARSRGATVVGTASPGNHAFLLGLGILPLSYGDGLANRVREAGVRLTAAVDCHGRGVVDTALALGLSPDRVVTIVRHDVTAELGLASPGMRPRTAAELAEVAGLVVREELTIPVQAFGLDRAAEAFTLLDGGHVRGKLVVEP
ncbi:NADP-dependent oxidoreductase [Streptomyces sp. AS02]|uniref:NADP-dependent oxidoreductase n=1 Tax=Streptomyces sp. AS02 TaxID=2938946 RepID=UPI00202017AA|nr:NADP-dependent oxidoreductase [Streptomyces sp. AS02]MCL8017260.1 NADP-dependent oxidoreductase [Streptomyces sp. AS02]